LDIRYKVTGVWRRLYSEEFYNLYSSPNIIRQIKSRRMGWVGRVARMGGEKNVQFCWESPKGRNHSEDRGVDGRMGSEYILERLVGVVEWIELAEDKDLWRLL
jgi:hypothetical protein